MNAVPLPRGGEGQSGARAAFTLVELLVVIGIMLLLAAMTIGAINLSITSERVRGGARQVQSLIEGARDRPTYAQQPRGIRILVNEQITEPILGKDIATLATTIVYIGSPGEDTSQADIDDVNRNGDTSELFKYINVVKAVSSPPDTGFPRDPNTTLPPMLNPNEELARKAIIGVNTRWAALAEQGIIGPGTVIRISPNGVEDARESDEFFTIDPRSFPVRTEAFWFGGSAGINVVPAPLAPGNVNAGAAFADDVDDDGTPDPGTDEVLFLTYQSQQINDHMSTYVPPTPPSVISRTPWYYVMETNPDVLPGEDASILPRNTCIDLQTSHLPAGWLRTNADGTRQYSSRMDLLFSPNGSIIGGPGAAGLIHLHICDIADAIANIPPGSPIDPAGEPRNGDEFGVTIFTRAGRVNVHPMIPVDLDLTDNANPSAVEGNTYPPNGPILGGTGIGRYDPLNPPGASAGDIIAPSVYNGLIYVVVNSSGGAAAGEPRWNLNPGGLTVDGGLTWRGIKHDVWFYGVEGELAK